MQSELIVWPAAQGEREIDSVAESVPQSPQPERALVIRQVGYERDDQAFAIRDEIRPFEDAPGLAPSLFAEGQKTAEARISGSIRRIDQHGCPVSEVEPATDNQANAGRLGRFMSTDDAGERIPIDDGDGLDPSQGRLRKQFLAGGRAAQEAEV